LILSDVSIKRLLEHNELLTPYVTEKTKHSSGASYGLSQCGYDIRLDQDITIGKFAEGPLQYEPFCLASSLEYFKMPDNVVGFVKDKSTWARQGLSVFNTVIEPGWEGYLTLELAYLKAEGVLRIPQGAPIAQVVFQFLDRPTSKPYDGKYQNQRKGPQEAILV